jgi:FkbM family methyltransferase
MLLNFEVLKNKYDLKINGVLHIGAHFGEEYQIYESNNIKNLIFFEPVPVTFEKLKERLNGRAILVNTALGNFEGRISMNIETANQGQSSSILKPALHLSQYPHIKFENEIEVDITTLDTFMDSLYSNINMDEKSKYNMINIDVQGYELEVFKGATKTLENVDYIITEVNQDVVYHKCALVDELDNYLNKFGFVRVETDWAGYTWGDAFYIKKQKND